jgi:hypothetical protein
MHICQAKAAGWVAAWIFLPNSFDYHKIGAATILIAAQQTQEQARSTTPS